MSGSNLFKRRQCTKSEQWTEPLESIRDFTSIPEDLFGKQTKKTQHKNKNKKNDEKLQNLDLLEGGLKGRVSYPKVE